MSNERFTVEQTELFSCNSHLIGEPVSNKTLKVLGIIALLGTLVVAAVFGIGFLQKANDWPGQEVDAQFYVVVNQWRLDEGTWDHGVNTAIATALQDEKVTNQEFEVIFEAIKQSAKNKEHKKVNDARKEMALPPLTYSEYPSWTVFQVQEKDI
jgi:hypothetical protein